MRSRPESILACLVIALLWSTAAALAGEHRSESGGYVLGLPDGWRQIPHDTLMATMSQAMTPTALAQAHYDAGFQSGFENRWFEYPYVLTQTVPYSDYGKSGPLSESEMKQLLAAMSGLNPDDLANATLNQDARGMVSGLSIEKPAFDSSSRTYLLPMKMKVPGIGEIRGLSKGIFTDSRLIQVNFYTPSGDWDRWTQTRDWMLDSFRPLQAQSVRSSSKPMSEGDMAARAGTIVGAVVGVLIAVGAIFGVRKILGRG